MGRLLDPIADKLLILSGLILLVQMDRVEAWIAIAMIAREIIVTGFRAISAFRGVIVSAGDLGKFKVVLQITGIILLILEGTFSMPSVDFFLWGTGILYVALLFSVVSGVQYLHDIIRQLIDKGEIQNQLP